MEKFQLGDLNSGRIGLWWEQSFLFRQAFSGSRIATPEALPVNRRRILSPIDGSRFKDA